jgi:tripartite-type tricarboxylate transporter receptor subunit TctC
VQEVGADPTIKARLEATGQLSRPSGAEEFAASIEKQRAQVAAAAKRIGLNEKAQAK